jgi:hypothetical protein
MILRARNKGFYIQKIGNGTPKKDKKRRLTPIRTDPLYIHPRGMLYLCLFSITDFAKQKGVACSPSGRLTPLYSL